MANQSWNVFFSGHVQGVGFRFQTNIIASRFKVVGWVANLANGDVQMVAEGDPEEIGRFVEAIKETMGGYIRAVEIEKKPATGGFSSFEIRRI